MTEILEMKTNTVQEESLAFTLHKGTTAAVLMIIQTTTREFRVPVMENFIILTLS